MTALLFLTSFAAYLIGLSGTVPAYRDSGDLVASIHTLGIAHPPGYALYILVGKLFVTLLPLGNVAYRINVMSALFAALASVVVYRFLRKTTSPVVALCMAAVFASSPAVMALARVPEMYTLSALMAGLIVYLLQSDHPNGTAWAALLLGAGLSVHATLIFLVPLFGVRPSESFRPKVGIYFLIGLSIFLYLPIRAMQDPLLNWGDPSQWRNFWRVVTRADYGGLKLHPVQSVLGWTPSTLAQQVLFFFKSFQAEVGKVAILLGFLGVAVSFRRPSPTAGKALFVSWALAGPAFFVLSNLPIREATTSAILQPYLLIPILLWVPLTLRGVQAVGEALEGGKWVSAVSLVLLLAMKPWSWANERHDFYAYDYARNVLRMLPARAVLYDPDDPTHFTIQVLQTVEGRRPDVTLLSFFRTRWGYEQIKKRSPDLLPPIPIQNAQELQHIFWNYSALRRPFYAELPVKFDRPSRVEGLVYAAKVDSRQRSTGESRQRAKDLLESTVRRGDFVATHHRDFFVRHIIDYYASAHCNLGLEYAQAKEWDQAKAQYEAALAINPELTAAWNNLGTAAFERGLFAEALAHFQRGIQIDPNNEMLQKNAQLAGQKMPKNL